MQIKPDTGDTELIRRINRYRILDAVRRLEPVSRQTVCETTGLSRSTVSIAVNALMDEGVLCDVNQSAPEAVGRGRPTSHLRLNPNAAYVAGVKLAPHEVSVITTNLRAETLAALTLPVQPWRLGHEGLCHLIDDGLRAAVARGGISTGQIAGVSIILPRMTELAAAEPEQGALFAKSGRAAFAGLFGQRIGLPVTVAREVDFLAEAERWFGHARNTDNFMVVHVGATIDAASYVNGTLLRGPESHGLGFGHMTIDRSGPRCHCGRDGCMDVFASDHAIIRQARTFFAVSDDEAHQQPRKTLSRLALLAQDGHPELRRIFSAAGEAIGTGIGNAITLVCPAKVILAGCSAQVFDLIAPAVFETIQRIVRRAPGEEIEIVFQDGTEDAWERGAAAQVLGTLYRHPVQRA